MAGWVPQIVFILVGGVVSDRLPRHLVLVGSNVVSGAAQLAAAGLLLAGSAELWHLAVAQVVRGAATSFFFPASTGLVPQTVPERLLQQANALLRMTTNASIVFGAAAGGLLVAAAGAGWALAFDGVTYLASAAVLLAMRIPGLERAGSSFVADLREGWNGVPLAAVALGDRARGALREHGVERLGAGARPGRRRQRARRSRGLGRDPLRPGGGPDHRRGDRAAAAARAAAARSVSARSSSGGCRSSASRSSCRPWRSRRSMLVAGIGLELFGVYWDTALQQHVPLHALSRVSSYDALGSFVAIPIGLSLAGPAADALGVSTTLWLALRDLRRRAGRGAAEPARCGRCRVSKASRTSASGRRPSVGGCRSRSSSRRRRVAEAGGDDDRRRGDDRCDRVRDDQRERSRARCRRRARARSPTRSTCWYATETDADERRARIVRTWSSGESAMATPHVAAATAR